MGSSDAGSRHWNATAAVYPGLQGARNENRLNNTWAQAHWAEAFLGLRPSGPQFEPGHWAAQTRLVNIFATFFWLGTTNWPSGQRDSVRSQIVFVVVPRR